MKIKLFISFVLLVVGTFSLTAQTYNYSYTDPCTGNTQTIVVPINGQVTVGYYGFVETFSYNEFNDGTFDTWTNSVFSQFQGSPCAEIVGITSTVTIAQDAAFNVLNILNSLSALSDFAGASGATDLLTGSISAASNSSGSSEGDEENNESNGSSTTQNGETSTGSNQVNSGTGGNEGTGGSTGENPAGTGGTASTQTGSNETGSQTTGQSVGSSESNNQTANGNTNESNSSVNSGTSGGNGNGGNSNGNSESNQESQQTEVNNTSNTETNETQNGNGNNSSSGSTTGSGGSSSSEGSGSPTNEETPSQTEGEGKTNITGGATKTVNANKENGNGAPTVIASSDFVGFNFRNSEVTTGLKLTGGYHSLRWDGARAHGFMADYVSALKGPNITSYYAWVKPKSISMLSLTGTLGFEGLGSFYGTLAGGQMLLFPKVKNLKAVYMATISYGQVYKTPFTGSALIAGGMYDVRILKRVDIKLMGLFVYVPYISYYNDLVLKSPYVVIPSIGTNIAITKRFKFNINAGGAWAIKENALNYTVTCGTRLLVGQ